MVTITIYKDAQGSCTGFSCSGHAEYDDPGMDIVCSAVSVLTIGCCNAIEKLAKDPVQTGTDEEEGLLIVSFPQGLSHDGNLLVDAMALSLQAVEEEYGGFIEFHIEEV